MKHDELETDLGPLGYCLVEYHYSDWPSLAEIEAVYAADEESGEWVRSKNLLPQLTGKMIDQIRGECACRHPYDEEEANLREFNLERDARQLRI